MWQKKIAAELSRAESCANTISPPVLSRRFLYMCPSIISFPHFPHCCLKPKSNPLASYTISCFALFSLNQILCHHNITSMKHPLSLCVWLTQNLPCLLLSKAYLRFWIWISYWFGLKELPERIWFDKSDIAVTGKLWQHMFPIHIRLCQTPQTWWFQLYFFTRVGKCICIWMD